MNYAQLLAPDFALILMGYLLCRFSSLDRRVWEQIDKLVYYFLFPILMFSSIVKTPIQFDMVASFIPAGLLLAFITIGLAYALPHLPFIKHQFSVRDHAGAAQIGFRFNSFVGLALVERLVGAPGLLLMAVLLGFCVPLFNVAAIWPMARHSELSFAKELLRNPLIISTVLGISANFAGFHFPDWLAPTVNRIGTASLPLGLMAAGAGMQLSSLVKAKTLAISLLSIRHVWAPLIAFGIAYGMNLSILQSTVLLTFSGLPTAASSYVLAARMGFDGSYVSGLVTISTLLGVLSLPFALGMLKYLT